MAKRHPRLRHTHQLHLGSRQHLPTTAPRHLASARLRLPLARRRLVTVLRALRSVAVDTCPPLLLLHRSILLLPLAGLPRAPSRTRQPLQTFPARRRRQLPLATVRPPRPTAQRLRVSEIWTVKAWSIMARAVPLYHHQPIQINIKKNYLAHDISELDDHFLFTICGLSTYSLVSVFLATFKPFIGFFYHFLFFCPTAIFEDAQFPAVSFFLFSKL